MHHLLTGTFRALGDGLPGINPVKRQAGAGVRPGQLGEGGKQVHHMEQCVALGPRRYLSRPAKRSGNPDAALVELFLVSLERPVIPRSMRASVVVQKDDQGVVKEALALERAHDLAGRVIHGREHGLQRRVRQMTISLEVLGRRLVWIVHCGPRQIQEEGTAAIVTFDQLDRFVRQEEGRIPGLDHRAPVAKPIQDAVAKMAEVGDQR